MLDQLLFVSRTSDPVAASDFDNLERELGGCPGATSSVALPTRAPTIPTWPWWVATSTRR
jgi:hypothetical protein